MRLSAAAILTAILAAAPPGESLAQDGAVIRHCQVFFIDDLDAPALEAGQLVLLDVDEGAHVKQGQLLAQIDDRRAQLAKQAAEIEHTAAQAKASDDIEVRYAEASFELAETELNDDMEINRKQPGAVSLSEIRRKRLAKHRAELQIDRSRLDMRVAQMNTDIQQHAVEAALHNIERCRIESPFDGVVLEVMQEKGEWVDAGQPVLRVVRMDRLRVEGFLDASQFNPEDVDGREVTVQVERANGRSVSFRGTVVYVSPLIQGGRYRLRAEVDNIQERGHWLLSPGASATMTIHVR